MRSITNQEGVRTPSRKINWSKRTETRHGRPAKCNNYNKTRSIEGRYRFWEFAVSVYMVWCTMQWSGFEFWRYRFWEFTVSVSMLSTNKDLLWKDFCMNLFACCSHVPLKLQSSQTSHHQTASGDRPWKDTKTAPINNETASFGQLVLESLIDDMEMEESKSSTKQTSPRTNTLKSSPVQATLC